MVAVVVAAKQTKVALLVTSAVELVAVATQAQQEQMVELIPVAAVVVGLQEMLRVVPVAQAS